VNGSSESAGLTVYMGDVETNSKSGDFDTFVTVIRSRLQRVLVAKYGVNLGVELTAEVESWAWENFDQLRGMNNPLGYLYRVAQSRSRKYLRWKSRSVSVEPVPEIGDNCGESLIELHDLLSSLTENQRVCVLLVHAYGWTYSEVARVLEVSTAAVGNHVTRGLTSLRGQVNAANDPLLANPRMGAQ